ncbi:hypothetical protein [Saprospira grandis]|uniref:hypothetical protein n=1 Tax=Saprospira grandis TaxID=1008 RepID=UPI0022DD309D|nr:hypothetical protein [Saprospira grandis]WBM74008.1 hypothetical protein OP864_13530 [Saprospira grandis]
MKNDIPIKKVEGVGLAIVPAADGFWDVYLLNLKKEPIKQLIVSARGYGRLNDKEVETANIRYYFEEVPSGSFQKIEPLHKDLVQMANEYWISFLWKDYMYDRKYVFVAGSIQAAYFTHIPILNELGVLIK